MQEAFLALIEQTLAEVLPTGCPETLHEAMRYAVGTGGKRIRPLICLASAVAVGGRAEEAKYPAVAIELLHNYTLVHDDLPAMDNDTLRRGQPTVWAKYGEARAILVGDALQALAYQVAAKAPRNVAEIVAVLGEKGVGVVQGQVVDIFEKTPATIDFIYEHKTADLFLAAALMGGYAGGGSPEAIHALGDFALALGLAFQYEDDLLDGDSPYDTATTEKLVQDLTARATAALQSLPGDTTFLSSLADKLRRRKS